MARNKRPVEPEPTEENTAPDTPAPVIDNPAATKPEKSEPADEPDNDQTSKAEEGENASLDQIESRKDAQLALEEAAPDANATPADGTKDPEVADDHQLVPTAESLVESRDTAEDQNARVEAVRDAFVKEQRAERLDNHSPQRTEDVRIVVETNNHPDRSGDNLIEGKDQIVMSDGVDEARMIEVQPAGVVAEEFDLGGGITQTNLK